MNDSENKSTSSTTANGEGSGIEVNIFGRTDVGLVRDHNEDNFLIADLTSGNRSIRPEVRNHVVGERGSLFAVCDGMGGAAAGEVASKIGVDTIYEMMQEGEPPTDDYSLARRLDDAISEAGTRIFTAARLNRGQRGMGTTATVATLIGPRLVVGQVGDSRAHIVRGGKLVQITKDQSLVQQLIDAKQLTEDEAKDFDRSNIILQALGTTEEVHVDITSVVLRRGDVLVMCSDGLSGMVEPEVIRDTVVQNADPMEACKRLTELACDGGGDDNITVIVARFDGEGLEAHTEDDILEYRKYEFPKVTETTVRAPLSRFTKSDEPPDGEGDEDAEKKPPGDESVAPVEGARSAPAAEVAHAPSEQVAEPEKVAAEASKPEEPARPEAPAKKADVSDSEEGPGKREVSTDQLEKTEKKGNAGLVIGVIVVLLAIAGVGIYVVVDPGADSQDASMAPLPAVGEPARKVSPDQDPSPREEAPPVRPETQMKTGLDEPRLEPIDEQHIVAPEVVKEPEQPKIPRNEGDDAAKEKNKGSNGQVQPSKTEKAAEPVDDGEATKPKKKPKPKKKKSVIDENPY